jgi:hypothetical protein
MEEYFGEDYDDYPEEYLPYQAKKLLFSSLGSFEYFKKTILRIPSLPGKKRIFSSVGSFEYFRETFLRITSLPGKE